MQKVYCSYVVNLLLFTHSHNPVGIFRNIKFKIVIIHYHIIYIWCPKFRIFDYVLKNVMPLLTFIMLTFKYKPLKGNFAIFYMLAKYVPDDIKYIFIKFYRHISTNNEANRKFVILISNFSTSLWRFKLKMHCGIEI